MANLRATIKARAAANATVLSLATGGVHDSDSIDQLDGGGMDFAPKESDGVRIAPHVIVRFKDATQITPYELPAMARAVEMYVYDNHGYDTIDQIVKALITEFHDEYLTADDRSFAHMQWIFTGAEMPAEEYGMAPSKFIRFNINEVY